MTCMEKLISAVEQGNKGDGTTPERWRTVLLTSIADSLAVIADKLPSVNPQEPKTGHWRHYEGMLICSECGSEFYDDIMEYCGDDVPKCCPDCGAKMKEVIE